MRATFYPFFSQQDKLTGKFLLESDSGVKLYRFIAEQLAGEGWEVRFVLPKQNQCKHDFDAPEGVDVLVVPVDLELDNLRRRLQWNPSFLTHVADCDIVFTQHEFLAYPIRCLAPNTRVVMECGLTPETAWPQTRDMFPLAWKAATAVHCNSKTLASMIRPYAKAFVWQFAYDEKLLLPSIARNIDVVFPARASSTNYSNHVAFVEAMRSSNLRVRMTDPTRYMQLTATCPKEWLGDPLDSTNYRLLLSRSKVVVGLTNNGYGGYAFREAIANGCIPVALYTAEYIELLGLHWPYYCESLNPSHVRAVVEAAVRRGWDGVPKGMRGAMLQRNGASSYQEAWKVASNDIKELMR